MEIKVFHYFIDPNNQTLSQKLIIETQNAQKHSQSFTIELLASIRILSKLKRLTGVSSSLLVYLEDKEKVLDYQASDLLKMTPSNR